MKINIINETNYVLVPEQEQIIKSIVNLTLEQEEKNKNATVDITIVSNEEIQQINKEYRGIDKVTDVLSFPMINFEIGENVPTNHKYLLGDIVFSYEKAIEQANEYEHSIDREIGFFIAHSMLHLLGYDHENQEQETIMMEKQEKILQTIGLTR